jgi:hypothetical protein
MILDSSRLLAGTVLLSVMSSSVAAATSCVVVSMAPARIAMASNVVMLEPKAPQRLTGCEAMTVQSGKVSVCYSVSGSRLCTELAAGGKFPIDGTSNESSADQFRATLLAFAKGDGQTKHGQTRDLVRKSSFLPHGELAIVGEVLEFPLTPAGLTGPVEFQIKPAQSLAKPASFAPNNEIVRIPKSELVAGTRYQWRAHAADKTLTGHFRVADDAQLARLKMRIDAIGNGAAMSPQSRAILLAETYMEEGFAFNAHLELTRAGIVLPE